MNKTIFTICSNNYLAQAKTLAQSVKKYNPNFDFTVILCDKISPEIDYCSLKIIEAEDLGIDCFDNMVQNYDIVELNTSIKPFSFEYLFKDNDIVIYLDPDTCLFGPLDEIEDNLKNHNAVLTPHICSPIKLDGMIPTENTFTNFGIYNLGFFAAKKSKETFKLLKWWKEQLKTNCKIDITSGIFVDQLPMNFAPLFFEDIKINKNLGINAAPWNIHERTISQAEENFYVNNTEKLVMFHFSNYNPLVEDRFTKYYTRAEYLANEGLFSLYDIYKKMLLSNGWEELRNHKCFYVKEEPQKPKKKNFIAKLFSR